MLLATFFLVSGPDSTAAGNVNQLFGRKDDAVQTWMPPAAWMGLLMRASPLVTYVPSHLVFGKVFRDPRNNAAGTPA